MTFGDLLAALSGGNLMLLAFFGGLITSILNMVGCIPIFFLKGSTEKVTDLGLGFASGVMLAASFTSLILPGIESGGVLPVLVGILLGALAVSYMDKLIPHMHFIRIGVEGRRSRLRAVWLFVLAITIHNMPEGLAVGVGFGSGNLASATALMIAIGLQNIPEGLSVGLSLASSKEYTRAKSYLIAALSGIVELPLAVLGAAAVIAAYQVLPYAMGFAAGAMIFVVSDEIIPEVHRLGKERAITFSLIIGLMLMLFLDVALKA
ncbi:MAG TPA: ZIP family metal transporter [Nitrososphaeria archaeon]|nr:ZIP family metal transporter [Nitrososphaeria archaeon]